MDRLPPFPQPARRADGLSTHPTKPSTVEADVSDIVWTRVRQEAERLVRSEPALAALIQGTILFQRTLEDALTRRLASRLAGEVSAEILQPILTQTIVADAGIRRALRFDILALLDRDPAATSALGPVLHFKGFHALETHRVAHALWNEGRKDLALYLRHRASAVFQVDIHPAVPIGVGVFIDHATGISVGETASIGDNVSILQGVTLGTAYGSERGDRHPKIARGVMIGAGARLLGKIDIGRCSRIGAGSVVVESVPANVTVAGLPARIVGHAGCAEPSRLMDQVFFDVGL